MDDDLFVRAEASLALSDFSHSSKTHSSRLDQDRVPTISIAKYLKRMMKYLDIPQEEQTNLVVVSFIYLDRYLDASEEVLQRKNVHMAIFVAIMLAHKYLYDEPFRMKYYSSIAGFPTNAVCSAEITFVRNVQFIFFVEEQEFLRYFNPFEACGSLEVCSDDDGEIEQACRG